MAETFTEAEVNELVSILDDIPEDAAEQLVDALEAVGVTVEPGETYRERVLTTARTQTAEVAGVLYEIVVMLLLQEMLGDLF